MGSRRRNPGMTADGHMLCSGLGLGLYYLYYNPIHFISLAMLPLDVAFSIHISFIVVFLFLGLLQSFLSYLTYPESTKKFHP